MKKEKMISNIEVYICNHRRENGEDCFHKGGKEVTDQLKRWSKDTFGKDVKIFRSGCLGKCEEGIAIATYPKKDFLLDVSKDDVEELKSYIKDQVI